MEGKRSFENTRMIVAVAWSQGGRDYMQDAFSLVLNHSKDPNIDFIGVFDGHGPNGENISSYVATNLCDMVLDNVLNGVDFTSAMQTSCLLLDHRMRRVTELKNENGEVEGGSTAVAAWFMDDWIYCANVGDSRMIISVDGNAVPITSDHKPDNPTEQLRIDRAGGFVENRRVLKILGVARAFGDYFFKSEPDLPPEEQMVTAFPDVFTLHTSEDIEFIVMASDGIWDVLDNQAVVDFVHSEMRNLVALDEICQRLLNQADNPICTIPGYARDNLTVIIAILR